MSEELNTKLEELLDAELTEDEVTQMEKEIAEQHSGVEPQPVETAVNQAANENVNNLT